MLDGGRLLGADRLPTRGRKGSAESLRAAAALVRRIERRLGVTVDEARIAPLRAVGTATLTIPAIVPDTGRLRVLAAGVATPGGTGTCVGEPFWLDKECGDQDGLDTARVALVPAGLGYVAAASRLRELLAAGVPVGRSWPAATRACSSPTASASPSRSSTRSTWPRPPPAPGWPWRSGRLGNR